MTLPFRIAVRYITMLAALGAAVCLVFIVGAAAIPAYQNVSIVAERAPAQAIYDDADLSARKLNLVVAKGEMETESALAALDASEAKVDAAQETLDSLPPLANEMAIDDLRNLILLAIFLTATLLFGVFTLRQRDALIAETVPVADNAPTDLTPELEPSR
jgi:hypothetical protein